MTIQTRPLLTKTALTAIAKRHIQASELTPRQMSQWANGQLIGLLNLRPASAVGQRVTKAVELCRKACDLTEYVKTSLDDQDTIRARWQELNRVMADLNARMSQYRRYPVVRAFHGPGYHLFISYECKAKTENEARRIPQSSGFLTISTWFIAFAGVWSVTSGSLL